MSPTIGIELRANGVTLATHSLVRPPAPPPPDYYDEAEQGPYDPYEGGERVHFETTDDVVLPAGSYPAVFAAASNASSLSPQGGRIRWRPL